MNQNAGTIDRGARILIGLALFSLFFFGPRTAWGLLGVVPLVTGIVGSCPLYSLFGWSTCRAPRGTGGR